MYFLFVPLAHEIIVFETFCTFTSNNVNVNVSEYITIYNNADQSSRLLIWTEYSFTAQYEIEMNGYYSQLKAIFINKKYSSCFLQLQKYFKKKCYD